MAVIAIAVAGPFIFQQLGFAQPPDAVKWVQENRMGAFGLYFVTNMLSTKLLATGAFEVSLDGQLLFSALEHGGRIPSVQYVAGLLMKAGLTPAPEFAEALANAPLH